MEFMRQELSRALAASQSSQRNESSSSSSLIRQRPSAATTAERKLGEVDALAPDAFVVIDTGFVKRKLRRWRQLFPGIQPCYAVKCNPDPAILRALLEVADGEFVGFDCASAVEIRLAMQCGASPEQILYAHPVKPVDDLRFALESGIYCMTLDALPELRKIKEVALEMGFERQEELDKLQLILRLRVPDAHALCPLGSKFGATLGRFGAADVHGQGDTDAAAILEAALEEGLPIRGLSFHVGSGCSDPKTYDAAVQIAHDIAMYMEEHGLPRLNLLDVGGGFPGTDGSEASSPADGNEETCFYLDLGKEFGWDRASSVPRNPGISTADVAKTLNASLARTFLNTHEGIRILAEPGRYFAAGCQMICAEVFEVRRREAEGADPEDAVRADVFISEGVFGAFKDAALLQDAYKPRLIRGLGPESDCLEFVCIRGPSGRPHDVVCPKVLLPALVPGSWLAFVQAGAYTTAIASNALSSVENVPALYV